MKMKKSGLTDIFTVHPKFFMSQKSVSNDDMQQLYIQWPAHEISKYTSNESTAGSARFQKLTTAKTSCTHNAFRNEDNFRKKITSL